MRLFSPVADPKKQFLIAGLCVILFGAPHVRASSAKIVAAGDRSVPALAALRTTPEVLHFKNVAIGQTSWRHVTLTNLSGSKILLTGMGRRLPAFRIQGLKFPVRIGGRESISFEAAFTPNRQAKFESEFDFRNGGFKYAVLHADGKGVAHADSGLASNPRSLDFGNVNVGLVERRRLTLSNRSATDQTVTGLTPSIREFSFSGLNFPFTLAPGESISFEVFFNPDRITPFLGSLIVEGPEKDLAIPVAGKGRKAGEVAISPAGLNFGNVNVGGKATLSGALNAGSNSVTIYSAGITSSEFALSGLSFPLTIPARHSRTFAITFLPTTRGPVNATVSFQTNDMKSRIGQTLAGTGNVAMLAPSPSHHVTLTWNAAGSGISGYNIFRGTMSGGPYAKLNSIPDSNTSYQDSNVIGGQTYFYVTTAIAANGTQSGFSNQIEVAIP